SSSYAFGHNPSEGITVVCGLARWKQSDLGDAGAHHGSRCCTKEIRVVGHTSGFACRTAAQQATYLLLLSHIRGPERRPLDGPVSGSDQACATNDVAECDGNEIVDDARYRNSRGVEVCRNIARLCHEPGERQKIHVGNAVLEPGRNEG